MLFKHCESSVHSHYHCTAVTLGSRSEQPHNTLCLCEAATVPRKCHNGLITKRPAHVLSYKKLCAQSASSMTYLTPSEDRHICIDYGQGKFDNQHINTTLKQFQRNVS